MWCVVACEAVPLREGAIPKNMLLTVSCGGEFVLSHHTITIAVCYSHVRIMFWGLLLASTSFLLCIMAGSAMFLQSDGGVVFDSEIPAFFLNMQFLSIISWASLMVGGTLFTFGVFPIILATYGTVDAWAGIGVCIFVMLIFAYKGNRSNTLFNMHLRQRRLYYLRRAMDASSAADLRDFNE